MTKGGSKVGVIDAGIGTWRAFLTILDYLRVDAEVVRSPESIANYSHIVLPGVGHFTPAATRLEEGGWVAPLKKFAESGKPFLGVCLGMQLLGTKSVEGPGAGLGLIDFETTPLSSDGPFRVPNIGWNRLSVNKEHHLLQNRAQDARFYFSHSFAVTEGHSASVASTSHNSPFSSVIVRDNVAGAQFHPEKSQLHGINFLENFVSW